MGLAAADVCRALGMNMTRGITNYLEWLDKSENHLLLRRLHPNIFMGSKSHRTMSISESGLYKLVMRSTKPVAVQFQDWVTKVVLPAIRKDGAYVKGEELVATGELSEDEFVLRAITMLQRKVERLAVRWQTKAAMLIGAR